MTKINSLLTERLKQASEKPSKMTGLAELSSHGNLSSFSGVFRVSPLSQKERETIEAILQDYQNEPNKNEIHTDLSGLLSITSEVKAINNQAAILHGERIKKAQTILKKYRDGAFTAWLIAIYGNRQTPYNFLQYYELYISLPQTLHINLDSMPRQAVYTLASRSGAIEKKEEIIKNYAGEPKQELLALIRQTFPLEKDDKRAENVAAYAITHLNMLKKKLSQSKLNFSSKQKKILQELLKSLHSLIQQ